MHCHQPNCHHQIVHSSFILNIPPQVLNAQVVAFNETMLLNVFRNYVSNEYITVTDKDPV